MRKTTANPDRLVQRAQRHVQHLEGQLAALSGILTTLAAAVNQGDIAAADPEDITGRLRWVEHEEAVLAASLDAVIAQTSELMCQLDATCSPEVFLRTSQISIAPFPKGFQEDMNQSFQQAAAQAAACPPPGVSLAQDPSMEYPNPSLSS